MVKLDLLDTKREEPWVYEPKVSKDKQVEESIPPE